MKAKKKIILTMLVLVILAVFVGYKMYNKPHVNVSDEKPDIRLNANTILADYSSDESAANTKYLEKIIQVKGIVAKVLMENGKGIITLKTNDDFGSVLGYLTADASKQVSQIKVGQEISLKGICTGFLMDVILVKCIII